MYHFSSVIFFSYVFFFFNDTATTEIYTVYNTLSLHDALPICWPMPPSCAPPRAGSPRCRRSEEHTSELQSLYTISYAVFCLKKKKKNQHQNEGTSFHLTDSASLTKYNR